MTTTTQALTTTINGREWTTDSREDCTAYPSHYGSADAAAECGEMVDGTLTFAEALELYGVSEEIAVYAWLLSLGCE